MAAGPWLSSTPNWQTFNKVQSKQLSSQGNNARLQSKKRFNCSALQIPGVFAVFFYIENAPCDLNGLRKLKARGKISPNSIQILLIPKNQWQTTEANQIETSTSLKWWLYNLTSVWWRMKVHQQLNPYSPRETSTIINNKLATTLTESSLQRACPYFESFPVTCLKFQSLWWPIGMFHVSILLMELTFLHHSMLWSPTDSNRQDFQTQVGPCQRSTMSFCTLSASKPDKSLQTN